MAPRVKGKRKRAPSLEGGGEGAESGGGGGVSDERRGDSAAAVAAAAAAAQPPPPRSSANNSEEEDDGAQELGWHSPGPYLPLEVEESLVPVLLRWKGKERGMVKDQPEFRVRQIREACRGAGGVPIGLALSLRRQHMKNLNSRMSMSGLRLGRQEDIRESARLFENAVAAFLRRENVPFRTEEEQKAHREKRWYSSRTVIVGPTPDFVLPKPLRIKRFYYPKHHKKGKQQRGGNNDGQRNDKNEERKVTHVRTVHWIEAKMFYGASTVPNDDNKSAVGCLMNTAQKYVRKFGNGAIVFAYGCGDQLAAELERVGVLALECGSRETVDLSRVRAHQRTWCADDKGNILP